MALYGREGLCYLHLTCKRGGASQGQSVLVSISTLLGGAASLDSHKLLVSLLMYNGEVLDMERVIDLGSGYTWWYVALCTIERVVEVI